MTFFLFFSMMLPLAFAQQQQPAVNKAETILDAVAKKTAAYTSIKIEFSYTLTNSAEKLNEKQVGSVIIKGDKYNLKMSGQEIMSDGKTVHSYNAESNEVIITTPGPEDDESVNLTKLLNNYKKNFKAKYIKEEVIAGKTVHTIDLTPIKAKSFYKVRVQIDKAQNQIYSVAFFDKSNNVFTYTVKKLTPNVSAPDTLFVFNKANHPGVVVVDMR
jgi:outer membrane lipoprotein carrier protein